MQKEGCFVEAIQKTNGIRKDYRNLKKIYEAISKDGEMPAFAGMTGGV